MNSPTGRHRSRDLGGLLVAAALVALFVGFLAGFGTDRYLLNGGDDGTPAAAATAPTSASEQDSRSDPTGSPAPPDPVASPGGEQGFLRALEETGVAVSDGAERELVLALGRGFCQGSPEIREDEPAAAERIVEVVGDRLSLAQAKVLISAANTDLC